MFRFHTPCRHFRLNHAHELVFEKQSVRVRHDRRRALGASGGTKARTVSLAVGGATQVPGLEFFSLGTGIV
jgi:hypothetical protein